MLDEVDDMFTSLPDREALLWVLNKVDEAKKQMFVLGLTATVGAQALKEMTKIQATFGNKNVFGGRNDFISETSQSKSAFLEVHIPSMWRDFEDEERDVSNLVIVTQLLEFIKNGNVILAVSPFLKKFIQEELGKTYSSYITDNPNDSKLFEDNANCILITPTHYDRRYPEQQPILRGIDIPCNTVIFLKEEGRQFADVEIVQAAGRLIRGSDHGNPKFRNCKKIFVLVGCQHEINACKARIVERSKKTLQVEDPRLFAKMDFQRDENGNIISRNNLPSIATKLETVNVDQFIAINLEDTREFKSQEDSCIQMIMSPNEQSGNGRSWEHYQGAAASEHRVASESASQSVVREVNDRCEKDAALLGSSSDGSVKDVSNDNHLTYSEAVAHSSNMSSPASEVSETSLTVSALNDLRKDFQEKISTQQRQIEELQRLVEQMTLTQNGIVSNGASSENSETNAPAEDVVHVTAPVTAPVTPPREPSITIGFSPPLVIKEGDCYEMKICEIKPNYILGKLALDDVDLKLKISKKRTPDSFNGWSEIPVNNTKIRIKFDVIRNQEKGNILVSPV